MKELRQLIRESYSREIPSYVVDMICRQCSDQLKQHLLRHINSTAKSPTEKRLMLSKMSSILGNMQEELKELVDRHVRMFLNV